jgi:hypothetical protein
MLYGVYLTDQRYSVPNLRIVAARDLEEAVRIAQSAVLESPYHLVAEITDADDPSKVLGTWKRPRGY